MTDASTTDYPIDRTQVARYFLQLQTLQILLVGIWLFGLGIVAAFIYYKLKGRGFPARQADALRYWCEGTTLRVDSGVYFLKRLAIPLDRITDVTLVQGPLLRRNGLWALHIQTAGIGGRPVAEAVLHGLENPEAVRDELMKRRDEAVKRSAA